jgi:hypothetical protein
MAVVARVHSYWLEIDAGKGAFDWLFGVGKRGWFMYCFGHVGTLLS